MKRNVLPNYQQVVFVDAQLIGFILNAENQLISYKTLITCHYNKNIKSQLSIDISLVSRVQVGIFCIILVFCLLKNRFESRTFGQFLPSFYT